MKKIISILTILMLFPTISAFTLNNTCSDTSTLYEEMEVVYYVDGALDKTELWNKTTDCIYGCNNGKCINDDVNFLVPLTFMFASFIVGYFAFRFDKEHTPMQVLFLSFSLILLIVAGSIVSSYLDISEIASTGLAPIMRTYNLFIWLFVLFLSYVFILFLYNVFKMLMELSKKNKEKKGKI